MADTIIGTTGIFFTLALIAIASFVIGLILYGISDYFRNVFSRRGRAASARPSTEGSAPAAAVLADAVSRAARHAAEAWIQHVRPQVVASPGMGWSLMAEFAALFLAMVENAVHAADFGGRGATAWNAYVHALRDGCAGNLHRERPPEMFGDLHRFLDERRAVYSALLPASSPRDGFACSSDACAALADRAAHAMGRAHENIAEQNRLHEVLADVMELDLEGIVFGRRS